VSARAVMIQGTSSGAGKSLLVTALCRWARQRGVRVAPFKAQNMSNNARVVEGGEIGTAQWLQAMAAGVAPDTRMNPVLLKPESNTRSQVVVRGRADLVLTQSPWRGRSQRLWPAVEEAYRTLAEDFELVVIEGAGSPAETNLWNDDIVNMRIADLADAPVALVADIDRGGAFAHLYGTWALLPPQWQQRIDAFILNKFRGDAALLAPAPRDLEARTGVPTVGVVPFVNHGLPVEEGPTYGGLPSVESALSVAVVCGPHASNLDEFCALQQVARVHLVRTAVDLDVDLVVLPGSKNVASDLAWLRSTGIAERIRSAAAAGRPILAICGGLQVLGQGLHDPAGVEGSGVGLGLLPLETRYAAEKTTTRTQVAFRDLPPPWQWLSHRSIDGYEIRHGDSSRRSSDLRAAAEPDGIAFVRDNILGVYVHGVLEDPDVLASLIGRAPPPLDKTFDQLAQLIEGHVDERWLRQILP
jgi:adenosylcobyric acid synthase